VLFEEFAWTDEELAPSGEELKQELLTWLTKEEDDGAMGEAQSQHQSDAGEADDIGNVEPSADNSDSSTGPAPLKLERSQSITPEEITRLTVEERVEWLNRAYALEDRNATKIEAEIARLWEAIAQRQE